MSYDNSQHTWRAPVLRVLIAQRTDASDTTLGQHFIVLTRCRISHIWLFGLSDERVWLVVVLLSKRLLELNLGHSLARNIVILAGSNF